MFSTPKEFLSLLQKYRVIPIGVFDDPERVVRVAELLLRHELGIIEVTLRTAGAYRCIEAVRKRFPECSIGAGSVLTEDAFQCARDAGAQFFISPCFDESLVACAGKARLPYIPGVATPTELHNALKEVDLVKFFPVTQLGGTAYINAVTAPYAVKNFHVVPTGGISEKNYRDYLQCNRVIACGMSYMVDKKLVDAGDYAGLEKRIAEIAEGLQSFGG